VLILWKFCVSMPCIHKVCEGHDTLCWNWYWWWLLNIIANHACHHLATAFYTLFFYLFIYLLFKVYFIVVSRPSPYLESCKKTKHPRLDYINHNYFWKPGLKLSKKQRINEELHPHRIIVSCTKISIRISINNLFIIILPSYHG
jgi:hypothetical protein